MDSLPSDTLLLTLSFLRLPCASNLCQTTSSFPLSLSRKHLTPRQTGANVPGSSDGTAEVWQTLSTEPQDTWSGPVGAPLSLTHSVQIRFDWNDQGWGNRKGVVAVVEHGGRAANDYERPPPATEITSTLRSGAGYAEHHCTQTQLSWAPRGYETELWLKPGGGGGHILYVENLHARVVVVNYKAPSRIISRDFKNLTFCERKN